MKNLINKTFVALAVMASVVVASAQDVGFSVFSASGTAINAGTNYAVIPAKSKNGGEAAVTYLNVNGLSANAITLTSYASTNQTVAVSASSSTTNVVNSTNGFVVGNWVVIQHTALPARFQCEAAIISSMDLTNHIVLVTTPVNAVAAGDIINAEVPWQTIPIASSATAREISNANGIISGQRTEPLLLTIISAGAGTNTINAATVTFIP
jgi:hypothetical protein